MRAEKSEWPVNIDCRWYIGEKPCRFQRHCRDCPHYSPMGLRIVIIKFGAMGDALRTTPILRVIREKYDSVYVTWITDQISSPLLKNNPLIDRLLVHNLETSLLMQVETFDKLYNFDKVPAALALAEIINAKEKLGFKLSSVGTLDIYNPDSEYSLRLGIDDPLKFYQNEKTYQEIIFEMAGMNYNREEYVYELSQEDRLYADDFFKRLGICPDEMVIGFNTGCGPVFATKKWTESGFIELAKMIKEDFDVKILVLGGPDEAERNERISSAVPELVINAGTNHPIKKFSAIVEKCDLLITGDTVAMHLAIALKTDVIGLFGPTCPQEIDLYGRGEILFTDFECAPCYKKICHHHVSCMENLTAEQVYKAVLRNLSARRRIR